jgi:hypothetical protein
MTGQTVLEANETRIRAKQSQGHPPKYWGPWFVSLKDSDMKKTRLNIFYHLGEGLEDLHDLRIGMEFAEAVMSMIRPQQWLIELDRALQNVPMPDTHASVKALLNAVNAWCAPQPGFDISQRFTQKDMHYVMGCLRKFEEDFEREEANLAVFIVTPKKLLDTRLLIEKPEEAFDKKIRELLPKQMLHDFAQAARCLAFEIPTACAFHVCRGTEALILEYYKRLSGHPWDQTRKDWGIYIDFLIKDGAPEKITTRLREIAKMDRNAYVHPDVTVTLDEAPLLFGLCAAVIFYMGQELERLTA